MKQRVLFLCTGNSCRSQMAEGLVNAFLGKGYEAYSAGTQPAGYVHPLAVQVMQEIGVDISGHHSKSTTEFQDATFDLVVTVCDDAGENCPLWLGKGKKVHLGFPDPARATGTPEEKLDAFRRVRDDIREKVIEYLTTEGNDIEPRGLHFNLSTKNTKGH